MTIFGGTPGTDTINSDTYLAPWYIAAAGAQTNASVPLLAGTLTNFKIVLSTAPGASQGWTFHINRDNVDVAGANCTVTGASATSCTIAGPVTFNNGQVLAIRADETTTSASTRVAFKADYTFGP